MVALDGVVFCAVDSRYGHGAAGGGEVDVLGALPPGGAGCACEGLREQCVAVVIDVAHAGSLGGCPKGFVANAF